MPRFKITGSTANGKERSIVVEASTFEAALEVGASKGLFKLDGHEVSSSSAQDSGHFYQVSSNQHPSRRSRNLTFDITLGILFGHIALFVVYVIFVNLLDAMGYSILDLFPT